MPKVRVNWGQAPEGSEVKLFVVHNTAHKGLYVLARDKSRAMSIAHTANHIYSPQEKHADTYSRAAHEVANPKAGDLLERWDYVQTAIAGPLEGTLHFDGTTVTVGDEVISE
jgi:hypothetical protein